LNCQENGAGDGLEPEWYIAHPSNIPERVMTSPSLKITYQLDQYLRPGVGAGRGGLTGRQGSWTGCNLKTGWCCMIAFLSCLNFALHIL